MELMVGSKSPKGLEAARLTEPFFDYIRKVWNCELVTLGHTSFSMIDGFIVKDNIARGLFEFKSRNAGYGDGRMMFNGTWHDTILISKNKIDAGVQLSAIMRLPFLLVYGFTQSNTLGYFPVTDGDGNLLLKYEVKLSATNRTVMDTGPLTGKVVRENCYIPINQIKII